MPHPSPSAVPAPLEPRHRLTLALLLVAGVAFAVMQTLVIPALPSLQREFGSSPSSTSWLVTGFLLSSSVLTPILGRLGDAHGKKRLLVISLGTFGLASIGAAFAPGLGWLIAFRILQGAGAAIFPLAFGIIRDEFPPEKVGLAIGAVSSVFGIGGGIGLVASGAIVEHLGRHWLFLLGGLPVLAATALIARYVPESSHRAPSRPDYLGAALLSAALVTLLVGLTEGPAWGWSSAAVVGLLAASALLLAVWIEVERRAAQPLVDLAMLSSPGMAGTNVATVLVGFSITTFFVLMPAFLQSPGGDDGEGLGLGPLEAGLVLLPFSVAMTVAGPLAGSLGTRRGRITPLRTGLALSAAALTLTAFEHQHVLPLLVWTAVLGVGVAFAMALIGALVLDHSRPEETGVASGMNSIMRTVGGAVGAQLAATLLASATPAGSTAPGGDAFTVGFLVAAAGAVLAIAPTALLTRWRSGARRPATAGTA